MTHTPLAPPAPRVPADLVHYLRRGRCVLFAGAGLSAWAELPTWRALVSRIVAATGRRLAGRPDLAAELARLVDAGKYLDVADYCRDKLGGAHYDAILARHLGADGGPLPEPHRLIAGLPFSAVVTTNFDRLLERAYAERGLGWPKVLTQLDLDPLALLLFAGTFFILKAHGDVDRPESVVLTTRDYGEIIHDSPAFGAMLSTMLLTRAILFVGYSLADADFRLLFERQLSTFRGHVPVRYALMSGVTSVEADVLFRSTGVKVIPYDAADGHGAVLDFLRALDRAAHRGRRARAGFPGPRTALARPSASPPDALELSVRAEGRAVEAVLAAGGRDVIARGVRQFPAGESLAYLLGDALTSSYATRGESYHRKVGRMLARSLAPSVRRALARVRGERLVVLRLPRALEPLPWELLWLGDDHLCRRVPVSRVPTAIPDQARGCPSLHRPARVLLIADPLGNLASAVEGEAEPIAAAYERSGAGRCTVLARRRATFDAVVRHLLGGDYDVVHFAGQAHFDDQEAFLALHGMTLLRASELRSLLTRRSPAVLVLNCPHSAFPPPRAPAAGPGPTAALGFMEAAATGGVGAFVGCFGEQGDRMAAAVAVGLHEELLAGTPMALALYRARLRTAMPAVRDALRLRPDDPTALIYALSGYPGLTLRDAPGPASEPLDAS